MPATASRGCSAATMPIVPITTGRQNGRSAGLSASELCPIAGAGRASSRQAAAIEMGVERVMVESFDRAAGAR